LDIQRVEAVKTPAGFAAADVAPAISLTKLRNKGKCRFDESISAALKRAKPVGASAVLEITYIS